MKPADRVYENAQIICWACGILFAVFFFGGLYPLMQFIPPPSPLLTGPEIISKYGPNISAIRFGIILCIIGCSLLIPWSAMVALQVARMEKGRQFPLWSITSFGAGCINAVFFILPFIFWAAAFYRIDRSPELIQLVNDMTWLEFVMIFPPFSIQLLCVAAAGFTQKEGPAVFPRWYLFMNVWMSLFGAPGLVAIFFYQGPFAWNGLIGFWLPVVSYAIFLIVTFFQFHKSIKSHKLDPMT